MSRSDAAWVDVLPRMKDFAGPLVQGVKDAAKQAGTQGGKALVDSMNAEARKADLGPVVQELEKVEKAAKESADQQASSAKKAADAVNTAKGRISQARAQEASATAQVAKAEADLEKRRAGAADRAEKVEAAEADLAEKREKGSASSDDLAKAEADLAAKRRAQNSADADLTAAEAKLEAARVRQQSAAGKLGAEESALKAAIRESKIAQEQASAAAETHARVQDELGRAVDATARDAGRAVPLWRRMWDGIGDTGGLKERVKSTLSAVRDEVTKEAGRIQGRGEALLGGIGKGVKWGGLGLAAGGAGLFGAAVTGGFNRLADIEDAKASLEGLGKSATTIDQIMKDTLASVKGTAFAMGDGAKVSSTLVASGIEPGKDLQRTLTLVADSATIAKRDLGDMGLIWSSVASKGKLQGDDAMQLLEAGIPIWQMIGKEMGITAGEAQELGSKGKVSFEVFRNAMEHNLGGAAQKSGDTVRGSFANMKAAVSRFGAEILEKVFPLIAPALRGVTDVIDAATKKVGPFIDSIATGAQGLYDLLVKGDFTSAFHEAFGVEEDAPIVGTLLQIHDGVKGVWDLLVKGDFTAEFRRAFGVEEDSPVVDFLFDVRDGIQGIWDILINGNFNGDLFSPLGIEEDSPAVDMLFTLRDIVIGVGAWVKDNLVPILAGLGGTLAYLGGSAVVGAVIALGGAIGSAFAAIGWIPLAIGAAVAGITWFFTKTELGSVIVTTAWEGIKTAAAGFMVFATTVLWPVLVTVFETVKSVIVSVWPVVQAIFTAVQDFLVQVWVGVVVPAIEMFVGYLQSTFFPVISRLWSEYIQPVFLAVGAFIATTWTQTIQPALMALAAYIGNDLGPKVIDLWQNVVSPAFTQIGIFIRWVSNEVIFPALDALKNFIQNVLAPTIIWIWQKIVQPAFAGISWAVSAAWSVIQVIFGVIKWTIENILAPVFTWLWHTIIEPAWDGIKTALSNGWNWIKDNVFTPLKNVISNDVAPAFQAGVDAIGRAWNTLKSLAMAPIQFVIDTVINRGLIDNFNKIADAFGAKPIAHLPVPSMASGAGAGAASALGRMKFASGGVLPGYTPGRDVHRFVSPTGGTLDLSGGEGIMRPEWVRMVGGPAEVDRQNALASGKGGSRSGGRAFAGGGVWNWIKDTSSDVIDMATKGWDFVSEALSDPAGALKKLVSGLTSGFGGNSMIDLAKSVPLKMVDVISDSLTKATAAVPGMAGVAGVAGGGGSGGSLGAAEAIATRMGLHVTSRGRRGARTAQNGLVSLHALGRAIDVAGPNMMAYFNAVDSTMSPTELLYSPAGARNKHRSGRRGPNTGATLRNHYSHVHVGFASGGVLPAFRSWPTIGGYAGGGVIGSPVRPMLYDRGGLLQPGLTLVNNASGSPEPVFTGRQGASIIQMLERGGTTGPQVALHLEATQISDADREVIVEEVVRRLELILTGGSS